MSIVVLRSSLELFSVLPSNTESKPVVVDVRSVVSKPNREAPKQTRNFNVISAVHHKQA